MYYLIYKITNNINGKIYIGKHKTKDKNDNYMGSGKYIQNAIRKYGKENFTKEILYELDSEEEMNAKEAEIVNEDFLSRKDTYNLAIGGKGGDFVAANKKYHELMSDPEFKKQFVEKVKAANNSPEVRERSRQSLKNYYKTHPGTFQGKHHTEQTRKKISESHKKLDNTGINNPTYGRVWVVHPTKLEEHMIPKEELPTYLEQGYIKGKLYKNPDGSIGVGYKKPKMSIQERAQIQKQKEEQRVKELGKLHCFINKETGRKKYFRDSELDSIDINIWQSTWTRFNIEDIKQMKKDGMSWPKIAEHYNTTYWDIYSWYRDNKDKFVE